MGTQFVQWLGRFLPPPHNVPDREQARAAFGAALGLGLTALLSFAALGANLDAMFLIAPMGASAVLVFGVPASPLAQPWSVVGGNVVSALVGITCARFIEAPMMAAPLAGSLAIVAMFFMRCLHPPGGAVALTAVLAGPAVHAAGYHFALVPVCLNSSLLVAAGLAYNNMTGRRYPHMAHSPMQNVHDTRDPAPTGRIGFSNDDLDAVLKRYGQVLDVSRDDLEDIILQTEMHAYGRRFGVITCADVMSKDVVTLEFSTELADAWRLLRHHHVHALPVLNSARRVIGIVTQNDFLHQGELDDYHTYAERFRRFIQKTLKTHSDKPEVVGQIMSQPVRTVRDDTPIVELVPLMANAGMHHIPVVNLENRFVGIVTQSDLVASLYESRLVTAPPASRGPGIGQVALKTT
ncbi:MAG: HPP family protein [Massilia sp.]